MEQLVSETSRLLMLSLWPGSTVGSTMSQVWHCPGVLYAHKEIQHKYILCILVCTLRVDLHKSVLRFTTVYTGTSVNYIGRYISLEFIYF